MSAAITPAMERRHRSLAATEEWRVGIQRVLAEPQRLRPHFQPIADLTRGVVAGYEALSRFEAEPIASPDRWFAAAWRAGHGPALEALALRGALATRGALPPNTFLTVNVGPAALVSDEIHATLQAAGDLRGIVVEITEEAPVEDYDTLEAALAGVRAAGGLIAVDDAGAGFASLRHIVRLRPDFIKLDGELVSGVDRDPTRAAVVETFGIFASRLDAWLIAEGIETLPELDRLIALEVPLGQGYGLAHPAPHMNDLLPDAAARASAVTRQQGTVGPLAEGVHTVSVLKGESALRAKLVAEPGADWIVLVDEFGRPRALAEADGRRRSDDVMRVEHSSRTADVARRALTRPAAQRFDPVVVCDEVGCATGLVRFERLVEALASTTHD